MKVSELGEFGLIERLADMVGRGGKGHPDDLVIGIGDDAAAWRCGDSVQLATTDSLVQDVHFSLATASWEDVGWKSLAVNLSDIAAMGGVPRYALVSLGLPGDTNVEDVVSLYRGMMDLAERFQVAIVGGDTVGSSEVAISVTVFGGTEAGRAPLTRAAARPGDVVAVTGSLGASAAGVEVLGRGIDVAPDAAAALRQVCLRPWPRVAEGRLLAEHGVRAAIDISDGLVSDLNHICRASRVAARVDVDRVPVSEAVRSGFGERALELALAGGEDFELLFTAPTEVVDRVTAAVSCPVAIIGEITGDGSGSTVLVDRQGNVVELPGTGWDHFAATRSQR